MFVKFASIIITIPTFDNGLETKVELMQFEFTGEETICSNYMSFRSIGS